MGDIEYSSPEGQVRLLTSDVDQDNLLLSDEQVTGFLTLEAGIVKLAAAAALEAIATSEVLVSKVIRTQDLATDGAKVAAELRARAASLRQQVADAGDGDDDAFMVVEFRRSCWPEHTHPGC